MIPSALLSSVTSLPTAVLAAVGVLGAINVRRRLRTRVRPSLPGAPLRNTMVRGANDTPAGVVALSTVDHLSERTADDAKDAALELLDVWSVCPQSTWFAIGVRCLAASHREAELAAASQLLLESVVAQHADPLDAWIVRDAVETAWWLAPRDRTSLPLAVEGAARRAVLNAALAVLARSSLPQQDLNRLLARAA